VQTVLPALPVDASGAAPVAVARLGHARPDRIAARAAARSPTVVPFRRAAPEWDEHDGNHGETTRGCRADVHGVTGYARKLAAIQRLPVAIHQ